MKFSMLREKIEIFDTKKQKDGLGGQIEKMVLRGNIWAHCENYSKFLKDNKSQNNTEIKRFVIRYTPYLSHKNIIKFKEKYYEIKELKNVNSESKYLEIIAYGK